MTVDAGSSISVFVIVSPELQAVAKSRRNAYFFMVRLIYRLKQNAPGVMPTRMVSTGTPRGVKR